MPTRLGAESVDRCFYDLPPGGHADDPSVRPDVADDPETLRAYVRRNVIGSGRPVSGPFGPNKVMYCDYMASGKSLQFIEDYIRDEVLPSYANTHSTTTNSSMQTTSYRDEARTLIRSCVRASQEDAVLFCGSGTTAAVHKLIALLELSQPPVVLTGPHEHHSNLLPWRELAAQVVSIDVCPETGGVDMKMLERRLDALMSSGQPVIGCFSAASNITGLLTDVPAVTAVFHRHAVPVFWDYAAAAPYVQLDMNPVVSGVHPALTAKDAMFFSMHKFVGGVQTPGVLVVKKRLVQNRVPDCGGGGTVFFVRRENHLYLKDIETREEGGTPAIVESIRAGMVVQVKEALGVANIGNWTQQIVSRFTAAVSGAPGVVLLGAGAAAAQRRLPLFSLLVLTPSGAFLHHNFVAALLNDLFGLETRAGCVCAGPYAMELLGIQEPLSTQFEQILVQKARLDTRHMDKSEEFSSYELLRPGFTRLTLSYLMSDEQVDYVINAVRLVGELGWKLLPQYRVNPLTGEWRHHSNLVLKERKWLGDIDYRSGRMQYRHRNTETMSDTASDSTSTHHYPLLMERARRRIDSALKDCPRHLADHDTMFCPLAAQLRWFLLPNEARLMLAGDCSVQIRPPFMPPRHTGTSVESADERVSSSDGVAGRTDKTDRRVVHCPVQTDVSHPPSSVECDALLPSSMGSICLDDVAPPNSFSTSSDIPAADLDIYVETPSDDAASVSIPATVVYSSKSLPPSGENSSHVAASKSVVSLLNGSTNIPPSAQLRESPERMESADVTTEETSGGRPQKLAASLPPSISSTVKWQLPPRHLFKKTAEAIEEFGMLCSGDRVLVCLSGGKDSLSLLHILHQYQYMAAGRGSPFQLAAVTVDPQSSTYDPRPLVPYLHQLGVPYFYEVQGILQQARDVDCSSICSFCSRMKRGRLYAAARRQGYNVLAFGQHLDDLAESFLMSAFHNGRLRTMKACYSVMEQDLRVVRPLVYVRENDLRCFARDRGLPVIPENCPGCFEEPKERRRVKQLLVQQEVLFPHLHESLRTAMRPLYAISRTGVETSLFGRPTLSSTRSDDPDSSDG